MNKNILYFLLLIVLAFATYWFVFKEHKQTYPVTEANFNVKDTSQVTKIFISNLNNQNILLQRTPNGWTVNDSFSAKQALVDKILEALKKQEARNAVEMTRHDNVVKSMSTQSNKVEVYTNNKRTNTFYVNRNANEENLCYMLTEGAKRVYVVKLPLSDNFLGRRYFTDLNEWRSTIILYATPADIDEVQVRYTDSTHYSYTLLNNGELTVKGNFQIPKPLNKKRTQSYLNFFNNIQIFGYEPSAELKDTAITKGIKLGELELVRKNKTHDLLELYFRPLFKGSKGSIQVRQKTFDNESFIGLLNKRDVVVINRKMTEKIFRAYHEFYEADKTPNP